MKYLLTLIVGFMLLLIFSVSSCEKPTPMAVEELVCSTEFTPENLTEPLEQAMSFLQIHAEYGYSVVRVENDGETVTMYIIFGFHNYYESKGFPIGRYMGEMNITIDRCLNFNINERKTWKV